MSYIYNYFVTVTKQYFITTKLFKGKLEENTRVPNDGHGCGVNLALHIAKLYWEADIYGGISFGVFPGQLIGRIYIV